MKTINGLCRLNTPKPATYVQFDFVRAKDIVSGITNGNINIPSVIPISVVTNDLGQTGQVIGRYIPPGADH